MRVVTLFKGLALSFAVVLLSSCASVNLQPKSESRVTASYPTGDYAARLPSTISPGEKTILVDPNVHAWGAYGADGHLIRAGLATAGNDYCPDIKRRCQTASGTFRIQSLGDAGCKSSLYPLPHGGAPMPYCMFFHGSQGLHGSPPGHVVEGNVSHGCVRVPIADAEWIRYNFANVGTKVIVRPY